MRRSSKLKASPWCPLLWTSTPKGHANGSMLHRRPKEAPSASLSSIVESPLRKMEVSTDLPERMQVALTEIKKLSETANEYWAAIEDWIANGSDGRFSLTADEVIAGSQPRPREHTEGDTYGTSLPDEVLVARGGAH